MAGKTGTTPKIDAKTARTPTRTRAREYQTSFVGFAPAKHPRFVDARHGRRAARTHYGGRVAAPAFEGAAASRRRRFKRIAQGILQVLRVPPDRPGPAVRPRLQLPVELAALCTEAGVASRVVGATAGVDVVDIAYRSERCGPGSLFCACAGRTPTGTTCG